MKCPRCKTKLEKQSSKEPHLYECGACAGVLIKQPQLSKLLEAIAAEFFASVDPDINLPAIEDPTDLIRCPECSLGMERYGYMGSNKLMMDGCNECNWLWLDALEVMAAAQMYVQAGIREQRYRDSYKPAEIISAHFKAQLRALTILH